MNGTTLRRWRALPALALVLLTAVGCAKRPVHAIDVDAPRAQSWPAEALEAAGAIPVQHLGRVKPLSTLAGFSLFKINGKRSLSLPAETGLPTAPEKLDPTAWLLDVMFFPEQAAQYEIFLVDDAGVLEGVGLRFEDRKRRDRYSYEQLAPARGRLLEAWNAVARKEHDGLELSNIDRQSRALFEKLAEFEDLAGTMDFARLPVPEGLPPALIEALGEDLYSVAPGRMRLSATAMLTRRDALAPVLAAMRDGDDEAQAALAVFEGQLASALDTVARSSAGTIHMLAPEIGLDEREEWDAPGDVIVGLAEGQEGRASQLEALGALAAALRERGDLGAVTARLEALQERTSALAEARGQYSKIAFERTFYSWNFFYNALFVFIIGFILAALSWLAPGSRWLGRGVWTATAVGAVLVVAGVTMRCLMTGRPPVATLYETILFITGTGVVTALVVNRLSRMPLALTVGTFVGALGMFMANRYEMRDAVASGDTIVPLIAVLDSNYWLATHVTTVTLGYTAGLLASIMAHVWLGARLVGFRRGDSAWYKQLSRAIYGVVAFGLLFSVFGTILGGVWANDSWGRFWGWDPKENGALMICLYELVIVHSRLGGYIKDFGVAVLAVLLGPVVAFSWWHVNLLGVGLHSYGFTGGIKEKLFVYYGIELLVAAVALGWWFSIGRAALKHVPPRR